jgi:hypothetical protein
MPNQETKSHNFYDVSHTAQQIRTKNNFAILVFEHIFAVSKISILPSFLRTF